MGRRAGLLRVPAGPRRVGDRLRPSRLGLAVRRAREAALERRVGGAVVAVRRDDRAVRQGPLDRRRLARPLRRHRPRGVRARAAAQRAVRVPQHRRPEDVDLEGPRRRRRTRSPRSSRPSSSASSSSGRGRTRRSSSTRTATDAIPRLFDEFDRFAAATAGREVKGELPPGPRAPSSATRSLDPDADVAAEAARFRPAFAHLALLVQIPGVDVGERVAAEKGSAARPSASARSSRSAPRRRAPGSTTYAPERGPARGPARRAARQRRPTLDEAQREFLAALAERRRPSAPAGRRRRVAGRDLRHRREARAAAGRAFAALYLAFLGRPNGPRAGWLLASLDRRVRARRACARRPRRPPEVRA